uniref:Netrin-1 n=1 Tax=Mola mola TaxID=94237 RepID=A0A3Q4BBJ9_MOLML
KACTGKCELLSGAAAGSRCSGRACNPRMGNLALGRVLSTQSVCGSNSSESFCYYKQTAAPRIRETCSAAKCAKCNSAVPGQAHPASAMSDSSFRYPDTWWQSAEGVTEETLRLDLETEFLFTHLILVFRSPRPAAMVLERSQDHGRTWETLRYFARDCEEAFGLAEGSPARESAASCTSKYSGAFPCARGEVSPCPCLAKHPGASISHTDHYAIYDFIVKGSCLCNGHADHCVPARGYRHNQHKTSKMVHGKCVCRHNTAGAHCERCAPLFNDQPWQAANGIVGTVKCKCKCNGHAESCHFSRGLWLATGRRSGGVCDDCRHTTEGRYCQNCKKGFFRDLSRPKTAPDSCKRAALSGGGYPCNPSSGECTCKPGVGGARCDSCMLGYWGLHEYGCRPCDCTGDCDPYTGDCISGCVHQDKVVHMNDIFVFPEKCECVEVTLGSPKLFCAAEYDYVLVVRVMSAHDKGSHAEVEVKVKKVLYQNPQMKIQRGTVTLYPESWTVQGCTCPILNPGSEYVVAGHKDWKTGRPTVNAKSLVKPWKSSLGRKFLHILRKVCGHR